MLHGVHHDVGQLRVCHDESMGMQRPQSLRGLETHASRWPARSGYSSRLLLFRRLTISLMRLGTATFLTCLLSLKLTCEAQSGLRAPASHCCNTPSQPLLLHLQPRHGLLSLQPLAIACAVLATGQDQGSSLSLACKSQQSGMRWLRAECCCMLLVKSEYGGQAGRVAVTASQPTMRVGDILGLDHVARALQACSECFKPVSSSCHRDSMLLVSDG